MDLVIGLSVLLCNLRGVLAFTADTDYIDYNQGLQPLLATNTSSSSSSSDIPALSIPGVVAGCNFRIDPTRDNTPITGIVETSCYSFADLLIRSPGTQSVDFYTATAALRQGRCSVSVHAIRDPSGVPDRVPYHQIGLVLKGVLNHCLGRGPEGGDEPVATMLNGWGTFRDGRFTIRVHGMRGPPGPPDTEAR